MSRFYVEQRVRFLGHGASTGTGTSDRHGQEASVVIPLLQCFGPATRVRFDDGGEITGYPYEFSPILPPKSQELVSWDEACFDRDGSYRAPVAA